MKRRSLFLALFAPAAPQDQTLPKCPRCGTASRDPALPLAVGDEDGVFRGSVLPGCRIIVCANVACRIVFAIA